MRTIMVTGAAALTAETVARSIWLCGRVCPTGQIPERVNPDEFAVYAGVFPEENSAWSKRFNVTVMPSACAEMA